MFKHLCSAARIIFVQSTFVILLPDVEGADRFGQ